MALNGLRLSKHDQYVEELCSRIKERYDSISKHVPVRVKKRMLAEVDVLAKRGESVDLYEVKCSPRVVKARKQLRRMSRYLGSSMNISNCYFYCGSSHSIMSIVLE